MTDNLWVREIHEMTGNDDKTYGMGGYDEVQDSGYDTIGDLFRYCQRTFGRCTSGMYLDKTNGDVVKVGWAFERRERYDECWRQHREDQGGRRNYDRHEKGCWFTHTVWVELHDAPPTVTTEYHIHEMEKV